MKGFIEVKDVYSGTVLINVSNIVSVKPLLGLNIKGKPAYSKLGVNTNSQILEEIDVEEKFDQIKDLIEQAQSL